jgi:hypothetical protein
MYLLLCVSLFANPALVLAHAAHGVEADIQQAQTELNLDKERYVRDRELLI